MAKAKKPKTKAKKSSALKTVAKAKAAGRAKAAGKTKAVRKPPPSRAADLAVFFRKLWSQPALLEQFSSNPAGREEVLAGFKLSAPHRALLVQGCVRDIIAELAGVRTSPQNTAQNTVIVSCTDDDRLECGHPECKAFMVAVAPG
jgi:hypothetical protein